MEIHLCARNGLMGDSATLSQKRQEAMADTFHLFTKKNESRAVHQKLAYQIYWKQVGVFRIGKDLNREWQLLR